MIYKSQIKYIAIGSLCGMVINAFQFSIAKHRKLNRKITELENENNLLNEKILNEKNITIRKVKSKSNW